MYLLNKDSQIIKIVLISQRHNAVAGFPDRGSLDFLNFAIKIRNKNTL